MSLICWMQTVLKILRRRVCNGQRKGVAKIQITHIHIVKHGNFRLDILFQRRAQFCLRAKFSARIIFVIAMQRQNKTNIPLAVTVAKIVCQITHRAAKSMTVAACQFANFAVTVTIVVCSAKHKNQVGTAHFLGTSKKILVKNGICRRYGLHCYPCTADAVVVCFTAEFFTDS